MILLLAPLICLVGLFVITGLGIALGKLVDPPLDRLQDSIEWEDCE